MKDQNIFQKYPGKILSKNLGVIDQSFYHHRIGGQFERWLKSNSKNRAEFCSIAIALLFLLQCVKKQSINTSSRGEVDFKALKWT